MTVGEDIVLVLKAGTDCVLPAQPLEEEGDRAVVYCQESLDFRQGLPSLEAKAVKIR